MDCKKAQALITPYIARKLNDKDLEEFLEHISVCEECSEELEIYYTVHYTLARLDEEEDGQVYNVKKALQNRLEESRFYVWKTKLLHAYRIGIMVLAEALLLFLLFSQLDYWQNGNFAHNPLYTFLSEETQETVTEKQEEKPIIRQNESEKENHI